MAGAMKLIQKEYIALQKNPSRYLQVYDAEDIFKWTVFIIAPDDSPYEKGLFRALIRFPDTYPMDPPSVQFQSEISHPNIYRDGKVCMSTLQNPAPAHLESTGDPLLNWRPVLGVEQIIVSLVSMLADPNCDDPANRDVAELCMKDHPAYLQRATACAKKSLEEIPDDFIVIPPCENTHHEQQSEGAEMMEISWQGSDNSDDGIVEFSGEEFSDDCSDSDEDTPTAVSASQSQGAEAEGDKATKQVDQQSQADADAAYAQQLQAELDGA